MLAPWFCMNRTWSLQWLPVLGEATSGLIRLPAISDFQPTLDVLREALEVGWFWMILFRISEMHEMDMSVGELLEELIGDKERGPRRNNSRIP